MSGNNGKTQATKAAGVRAAAQAVADSEHKPVVEYELNNGIVLHIKPVPPFLIRRAAMAVPRPKVPTFHNDTTGRNEANPLDPDYEREMAEYQEVSGEAGVNAMLLVGTAVKSLPKGIPGPESDDWLEMADFLRVPVELHCWKCAVKDPAPNCSGCAKARYLSWLYLFALDSEMAIAEVILVVGRGAGVTEEEVASAMESFRSGKIRRTDSRPAPAIVGDGDHVPEANPDPGS